jgi:hypothetical protein
MFNPSVQHVYSWEGIKMSINKNLQHYDKQAVICGKWLQVFDEVKPQFMELPVWTQEIIIEDMSTALQNRITVMQKANKNSQGI